MESFITIEWDSNCGIDGSDVMTFVNEIGPCLKEKYYGSSISKVVIVMTCMAKDFTQRKRYKKNTKRFEFDILLDYFLIKNVELKEKKKLIVYRMIKITEETFGKYKFEDFDTKTFLMDFKHIVESIQW